MATSQEIFDAMTVEIGKKVPGFQVRYKNESWSQKLIGLLARPFNPTYTTGFITTFYPYVYYPSKKDVEANPGSAWRVLAHEYVHLLDTKAHPILFRLRYVMPQILALLALGAIGAFWSLWFLLCLVFLLAAAPWPSRGRTALEMRGYTMSMAADFWKHGRITDATKEHIAQHFTGWNYYKMCPNEKKVRDQLDAAARRIESGEILVGAGAEPYADIHALLQAQGVVKTGAAANA